MRIKYINTNKSLNLLLVKQGGDIHYVKDNQEYFKKRYHKKFDKEQHQ